MSVVFQIEKSYSFEAAHRLTNLPETHQCARLHGHSYVVKVGMSSACIDDTLGWVMDFAKLDGVMKPLAESLDHRYLNDIPGLQTPTAEAIAMWFFKRVDAASSTWNLPGWEPKDWILLDYVEVQETAKCKARVSRGRE